MNQCSPSPVNATRFRPQRLSLAPDRTGRAEAEGTSHFANLGPWSPSPRPSMSTWMSHRRLRKHHRIHSTLLTGKAVKTLDGRYSTRKRTARRMGSAVYVALPMPIVNYLSFTDTEAHMRGGFKGPPVKSLLVAQKNKVTR